MTIKTLIAVVGPTAIGKTALGIKLAHYFDTEIISADSRQFYKEMSIGTAVPSPEELNEVKHHFIQNLSVTEDYSVGNFEADALNLLDDLFEKHDTVIMVGGSGLYVDAVTKGLDTFPKVPTSIRDALNKRLEEDGLEPLQSQLKELDPKYYKDVDLQNPHRVIRALAVCLASGKPYSSFLKASETKRPFKTIYVGLTADRALIYERINTRVDMMMSQGLLEEAKALLPLRTMNALNTVGYKELFQYLEGNYSLEHAVSEIKKNTRRFAKRQLTWFKRTKETLWFQFDDNFNTIAETIKHKMQS